MISMGLTLPKNTYLHLPLLHKMSEEQSSAFKNVIRELEDKLNNNQEELSDIVSNNNASILKMMQRELSSIEDSYFKLKQKNEELQKQLDQINTNQIADAFTKIFTVISDIKNKHFADDRSFNDYIEEFNRLGKPIKMKVYNYYPGDTVPNEDAPMIEFSYQSTEDRELNQKVCSQDLIGYKIDSIGMKQASKVKVWSFKAPESQTGNQEPKHPETDSMKNDGRYSQMERICEAKHENNPVTSNNVYNCTNFENDFPGAFGGKLCHFIGVFYQEHNDTSKAQEWFDRGKKYGYNN